MTRVIHKYRLVPMQINSLPYDTVLLSVGDQAGSVVCWCLVTDDPHKLPATRPIYVVGTGQALPPECTAASFVGTVSDGALVWHVFDPQREVLRA